MVWTQWNHRVDGPAGMTELHEQITAGEARRPGWWTRQGRAYRSWVRSHPNTAARESAAATQYSRPPDYERLAWGQAFRRVDFRGFTRAFGGRMAVASDPATTQTSTDMGCGFNPWTVGATAPATGTPLGVHAITGQDVSGDVLSWFKAGIISNPSAFVLSLPGLGKSTLIRKQFIGAVAQGHVPIVAGDIKPEYVEVTRAMVTAGGRAGQVIRLGHGHGHLNPLAAGALGAVIPQLEANREALAAAGKAHIIDETRESVHSRQVTMVTALVELIRQGPVADWEALVISTGLRELRDSELFDFDRPPLLKNLVEFIRAGDPTLMDMVVATTKDSYLAQTRTLVRSLTALTDGALGQIFAHHTSTPIDVQAPAICIDVSAVARGDKKLKAAVLLACWSDAYGAMEAAHVLADCGLASQHYFLAVLDELWQVLGAGAGMVQRVDELTRLNRTDGTGLLMITHTGRDLEALPSEVDVKTAMGFIERAGMVIAGGLPHGELDRLANVLQFTSAEAELITSWSRGAPIERSVGRKRKRRGEGGEDDLVDEVSTAPPLGRGKFMLKPSKDGSAGIPIQVELTPTEQHTRIHDTNVRFRAFLDEDTATGAESAAL